MSTNNYYQLYVDSVKQLAETIVIKSVATAELMNKKFTDYNSEWEVDIHAQNTWKYYLNISGEYHPSDEIMYVVSADTLQTIEFDKENLLIHRATARSYQYGTRQYRELVNKYPDQEMLILGILYPVDINKAIAAKDGEILGYPSNLVEPNEYSLIANLQEWIDGFKARWYNKQFNITDPLNVAVNLGIMYLNLIPAILNIRLAACKTNEAHSYHVKQYLASHGLLDVYISSMTLRQTLFIYRNIAYIERNSGQQNIFEWLTEHILTERGLPLSEYKMRHDLSGQPDQIKPTLMFTKHAVNGINAINQVDSVDLQGMLDKQDLLARENIRFKPDVLPVMQGVMENSLSNTITTKMLESSVVDYSKSYAVSLEDVLLNHWSSLSATGNYNAIVGVTNPKNGERIPLNVKDAYTFIIYAYAKSIGLDPDLVPLMLAKRVQNIKITG